MISSSFLAQRVNFRQIEDSACVAITYAGLMTENLSPEPVTNALSMNRPVGCSYLSPLGKVISTVDDMSSEVVERSLFAWLKLNPLPNCKTWSGFYLAQLIEMDWLKHDLAHKYGQMPVRSSGQLAVFQRVSLIQTSTLTTHLLAHPHKFAETRL